MTTKSTETPAERLAAIQARHEAATGEDWHWAGNTDTGEPYLATWAPGLGRCSVLAIGHEDRATTGREADRVRDDAVEFSLGDPDELVYDWAHDRFGQPAKDPRLWFFTDLMADLARKHVVYEVAPNATTREDPKVYRADIIDIRHPDAQFIAHARADVPWLLDLVRHLEEALMASEVEREDLDTGAGMLLGENAELQHSLDEAREANAALLRERNTWARQLADMRDERDTARGEAERLRTEVSALADKWERKHDEHITAGVRAATASSEVEAGLQVAAGSVRKLCADEVRAQIGGE